VEVSEVGENTQRHLIIDCGNTRTKFGIFENQEYIFGITSNIQDSFSSLAELLKTYRPSWSILSSVRQLDDSFILLLEENTSLIRLSDKTKIPIQISYESPHSLGSDRLADAVGGWVLSKTQNCLVVDCGTCITYNIVLNNSYIGGAISPGIQLRFKALNAFTDALPLVDIDPEFDGIGKNTENSIRSGVQTAVLLEVDAMMKKICSENEISNVYITGGDRDFFEKGLKTTTFAHPRLTLIGLNEILRHNLV
jgi:type III pantothenate kinase